jgi:hypothetical protein
MWSVFWAWMRGITVATPPKKKTPMCYYSSQRKRQMLYNKKRKGLEGKQQMPQTWFLNKLITWGKECKQTLVTLLEFCLKCISQNRLQ